MLKVGSAGSLVDVHATACKMADHLQEETAHKLNGERATREQREGLLMQVKFRMVGARLIAWYRSV